MCINCNIRLPVPNAYCDVFGLRRGALMSGRQISKYVMNFDYTTLSPKNKSLLYFLLGRNVDEALIEFEQNRIEKENNKGSLLSQLFELWELHPIGQKICAEMEDSVPGIYYATVQYFKVDNKQLHRALNGEEYLTGKYVLIDGVREPLEPIREGNWEYFRTMYDV
uniref:Uncharacterized protein n=1 Tax=Clandestinovirus TaxID=2831644 RepID=A0A8F8PKH5_9VIRU|nr:hypothetical protein KOM_12_518 [Clandestinovirus]